MEGHLLSKVVLDGSKLIVLVLTALFEELQDERERHCLEYVETEDRLQYAEARPLVLLHIWPFFVPLCVDICDTRIIMHWHHREDYLHLLILRET
jgi:hypothetical protein